MDAPKPLFPLQPLLKNLELVEKGVGEWKDLVKEIILREFSCDFTRSEQEFLAPSGSVPLPDSLYPERFLSGFRFFITGTNGRHPPKRLYFSWAVVTIFVAMVNGYLESCRIGKTRQHIRLFFCNRSE
jgi:hypothetical protein